MGAAKGEEIIIKQTITSRKFTINIPRRLFGKTDSKMSPALNQCAGLMFS